MKYNLDKKYRINTLVWNMSFHSMDNWIFIRKWHLRYEILFYAFKLIEFFFKSRETDGYNMIYDKWKSFPIVNFRSWVVRFHYPLLMGCIDCYSRLWWLYQDREVINQQTAPTWIWKNIEICVYKMLRTPSFYSFSARIVT